MEKGFAPSTAGESVVSPMLIVVSGLPGVGKTAVAAELARRLGAIHVSVDVIEDSLLVAGLEPSWTTGVAAYEAAGAVSRHNLQLGYRVVVDAVNDSDPARETWRRAAEAAGSQLAFFNLRLQDRAEHRRRLEGRRRPLVRVSEPSWDSVAAREAAYEKWPPGSCTVVDVDGPIDGVVAYIAATLRSATSQQQA